VYRDFSKAFDRVLHSLSILIGGSLLCWGVLSDRSDTTCQIRGLFVRIDTMSFRGSARANIHLGPVFLILDINGAFDIFENVSVLRYDDDLKLFMTIKCIGDCQLFQRDLDRLGEWCRSNKFELYADNYKSISFRRSMWPIEFVYSINGTALERVDEIKDLGVIMEENCLISRQLSPNHRGNWVLLSVFQGIFVTRILILIKLYTLHW
jgi:hypothetical protein